MMKKRQPLHSRGEGKVHSQLGRAMAPAELARVLLQRVLRVVDHQVSVGKELNMSLVFAVKDRVGALHDILVPFQKAGLNLTKIESRPSKKKAWSYFFFVDFDGHHDEPRVKRALEALEKDTTLLKVLGSYPKADF